MRPQCTIYYYHTYFMSTIGLGFNLSISCWSILASPSAEKS